MVGRYRPGVQPPPEDQRGPIRQVRVRRAPRYGVFLATGALLGLVIALVSGLSGPGDPGVGRGKLVGYLAIGFVLLGALLGGLLAVSIERWGRRGR